MRLIKAGDGFLPEMCEQLELNFDLEERRDKCDQIKVFDKDKFVSWIIEEDGVRVGFLNVWEFEKFTYFEHFVVYERFRGNGCGGRALNMLLQKYKNVVLEAEPPEEGIRRRRINFYERHGLKVNPQFYWQPPFRKGGKGCELKILSYPDYLSDFDGVVAKIYKDVYNAEYKK
ncbi:MAG: GNAT family N-acetyltransferase [Clostridia bacterium]|nr:GNAT family N-acetyltransferase [Clostridia bacterium]MDE7257266.1 GNAT family N-acetyltransferase [Clostridia bacterium]